ncbi:small cysteine-rich protein 5-like [Orbicella faveolata]|uniref:small cysteine-rich protein 5-like n=1 Tax=Orbicella faveolata TaxID=48498 RepID=UPI0009E3254F|nr:small cysteine-rich protein 5-like [Orbicella faveolata]
MAVKFQLCLLLLITLMDTAYAGKNPFSSLSRCDWPKGVCVYYRDSCPPDIPHPCPGYYCPLSTNKCCCRQPVPPPPPPDRCDWPYGVCAYIDDPCPPDIPYDCRKKYYCPITTNKCCCRSP